MNKYYDGYGFIWDGIFTKPVKKMYNISFCITCMDRLYDLKETLPKNIEDNKSYPNLEFVILDYNSNDGLGKWMKKNMMQHIESGKVVYYRTTEPKYFDMSHSRNIAFKVATGDIVNNLDADNYTRRLDIEKPEICWAEYLNRMANSASECPKNPIFAKGKQLLHGRIGFFKNDFLNLGGYDEGLEGYGHDDQDLMQRANLLDFKLYSWGGTYYDKIKTSKKEKNINMEKNWKTTEKINKIKSYDNIKAGKLVANQGKHWGKATLIKNFKKEIKI